MTPYPISNERQFSSILIIEDDDLYFEGLHRHFKMRCKYICHAANLEAAADILRQRHFDLIVVDLGLPDYGTRREDESTRTAVLERVISCSRHSSHLVVTGRFSWEEAARCRKAGALGYLSKGRLNAPTLANLLEQLPYVDFLIHSGSDAAPTSSSAVSHPVLSLSEEECIQWVERRPPTMKRVELFALMARHYGFASAASAEKKFKRARSKLLAYWRQAAGQPEAEGRGNEN